MVKAMQAYKELRDLLVKYEFIRDNGIAVVEGDYAAGVYKLGKEMIGVFLKAPSILARCGPLARSRWDKLLERFKPLWQEMRLAVSTSENDLRLPTWKRLMKNASGKREVTFASDDEQVKEKGMKRSLAQDPDGLWIHPNKKVRKAPSLTGELGTLDHLLKEAHEFYQSPSVQSLENDSAEVLGRVHSLEHQAAVVEKLIHEETDPSIRARALRMTFEAKSLSRLLQENTHASGSDGSQSYLGSSDSWNLSHRSTSSIGRPVKHLMELPEKMQKALLTDHNPITTLHDNEDRRRARDEAEDLIAAVPQFGGQLTEYVPWLDAAADYIALAYGSESAKCNALKKTLESRAAEVARTVSMGEVRSIESLVIALHQEFGNRDVNRVKLMSELKALKTPRLGHATELRDFTRTARRVAASLQTIGALEDRRGNVYDQIRVLLPQAVHLRWMDRGDVNDVFGLLDFLDREANKLISHMGACEEPVAESPSLSKKKASNKSEAKSDQNAWNKSKYSALQPGVALLALNQKAKCELCLSDCSKLDDCPRFKEMDANDRLNWAIHRKVHLVCLKQHPGGTCNGTRCKATSCQQSVYHHPALHGASNLPLFKGGRKKLNRRHEGGAAPNTDSTETKTEKQEENVQ